MNQNNKIDYRNAIELFLLSVISLYEELRVSLPYQFPGAAQLKYLPS